ncbi:MAG: PEP-CTERM sorting domain-containing protein [Pyrinomonadaceae bacterium]
MARLIPNGTFSPFVSFRWLSGIARSVDFGGTIDQIAFDNITLGSEVPGGGDLIPEPASMILLGTGLAGVIGVQKIRDGVKLLKPRRSFCIYRTENGASPHDLRHFQFDANRNRT